MRMIYGTRTWTVAGVAYFESGLGHSKSNLHLRLNLQVYFIFAASCVSIGYRVPVDVLNI